MENKNNTTKDTARKAPGRTPESDAGFRSIGIDPERAEELKELMIAETNKMKETDTKFNKINLIKAMAPHIKEPQEGLFLGIVMGEALMAVNNPLMGILSMIGKTADKDE